MVCSDSSFGAHEHLLVIVAHLGALFAGTNRDGGVPRVSSFLGHARAVKLFLRLTSQGLEARQASIVQFEPVERSDPVAALTLPISCSTLKNSSITSAEERCGVSAFTVLAARAFLPAGLCQPARSSPIPSQPDLLAFATMLPVGPEHRETVPSPPIKLALMPNPGSISSRLACTPIDAEFGSRRGDSS